MLKYLSFPGIQHASDVFNVKKLHLVGRAPWTGLAKDDELWAARLRLNLEGEKLGAIEFEPYIYYNEASDQKSEMKYDAKTKLGAYGLAIEYKRSRFECGAEVACNYGSERLRKIDRNVQKIAALDDAGKEGEMIQQYTKVNMINAGGASARDFPRGRPDL